LLAEIVPPHSLLFHTFLVYVGQLDYYAPPVVYEGGLGGGAGGLAGLLVPCCRWPREAWRLAGRPRFWWPSRRLPIMGAWVVSYVWRSTAWATGATSSPSYRFSDAARAVRPERARCPVVSHRGAAVACAGLLALRWPGAASSPADLRRGGARGGRRAARRRRPIRRSRALVDSAVGPVTAQPGGAIEISAYWLPWRAWSELSCLLPRARPRESRGGRHDGAPVGGHAPTSLWPAGARRYADVVEIRLRRTCPWASTAWRQDCTGARRMDRLVPSTGVDSPRAV